MRRFSLGRRSSQDFAFQCFERYPLVRRKVWPEGRAPLGLITNWRIVSVVHPILAEIDTIADHCGASSTQCSLNVRNARSSASGEDRCEVFCLSIAPLFHAGQEYATVQEAPAAINRCLLTSPKLRPPVRLGIRCSHPRRLGDAVRGKPMSSVPDNGTELTSTATVLRAANARFRRPCR